MPKGFTKPVWTAPSATNNEAAAVLANHQSNGVHATTPVTSLGGNAAVKGTKQAGAAKLSGGRF